MEGYAISFYKGMFMLLPRARNTYAAKVVINANANGITARHKPGTATMREPLRRSVSVGKVKMT